MLETLEWSAVKTWRIKVDENIEKRWSFLKKKDKLINSDSSNSFLVELGLSPSWWRPICILHAFNYWDIKVVC